MSPKAAKAPAPKAAKASAPKAGAPAPGLPAPAPTKREAAAEAAPVAKKMCTQALKQMLGKMDYDSKGGNGEASAARAVYASLSKSEKQRFLSDWLEQGKVQKSWKFANTFTRTIEEERSVSSSRTTGWLYPGQILQLAGMSWQDFPDSDKDPSAWLDVVGAMHRDNGQEFDHSCEVQANERPKLAKYWWVTDHGTTAAAVTKQREVTARSSSLTDAAAGVLLADGGDASGGVKAETPGWGAWAAKLQAMRTLLAGLQRQVNAGETLLARLGALGKRSAGVREKHDEYKERLAKLREWLLTATAQVEEWGLVEETDECLEDLQASLAGLYDTASSHLDLARVAFKRYAAFGA